MGGAPEVREGAERRCPSCGALVGRDAEWCGQCFASLGAKPSSEAPAARPQAGGDGAGATWPCPVCQHANPLDRDVCAVCGTPFARLMRGEEPSARTGPREAMLWSLAFPGLGHGRLGRSLEGLARGVLFAWLLGMTALLAASRPTGPGVTILVAFVAVALALYVLSAVEVYRLGSGRDPFVSPRAVLWSTAMLVVGSVLLLALVVAAAARR